MHTDLGLNPPPNRLYGCERQGVGLLVNREYVHSVDIYQKYLTRLGELVIFEPWRENRHYSKTSKIFWIYDNTLYVFYLSFNVWFVQFYYFKLRHA